jgi:hypothetical protein
MSLAQLAFLLIEALETGAVQDFSGSAAQECETGKRLKPRAARLKPKTTSPPRK